MSLTATIDVRDVDGRTLEELSKVIAIRERELKETASDAVRATAIRVLTSLRGLTKVATPDVEELKRAVSVERAGDYTAGWYRLGRGGPLRRCLRQGGHRVTEKFTDLTRGRYARGETVAVYKVADRHYGDKPRLVIAQSAAQAEAWAAKRVEARVKRYAGLAKTTLGALQNKLSTRGVKEPASSAVWAMAQKSAKVQVDEAGFNSGNLSIMVGDLLRYAELALKNGASDINLAMAKAANSIIGQVNKTIGQKKFATPFPEVQK